MGVFIKQNNELVNVGASCKVMGLDTLADKCNGTLVNYNSDDVTSVVNNAFYGVVNLKSIVINNATTIGNYSFNNCSNLESITMPNVTLIGASAFASCSKLNNVSLPSLTNAGGNAFNKCTSLTNINLPEVVLVGSNTFTQCSSLQHIVLPKWHNGSTTTSGRCFYDCAALQTVVANVETHIWDYTFASCPSLVSITLGANQVVNLSSTNSIPQKSPAVIIYVPTPTLVNSYKTATNWSTLYNNGYVDFQLIPV